MHCQGVLVQVDHPLFGSSKGSGFQVDNVVVAHGSILLPLCLSSEGNENLYNHYHTLLKDLQREQYFPNKHSTNTASNFIEQLSSIKFNVFRNKCKANNNTLSKVSHSRFKVRSQKLFTENATLCFVYTCDGFATITDEIPNWNFRSKESESSFDHDIFFKILPTFIFLMVDTPCKQSFMDTIQAVFKTVNSIPINLGDPVVVESTPFSNFAFVNSWSRGIISKLIGECEEAFLTDTSLTFGCEGAPVFKFEDNVKGALIGVVLHTMLWCNGEWVGFSLGLSIKHLLKGVLGLKSTEDYIPLKKQISNRVFFSDINIDDVSASVVFVRCANKWGSGVVIDSEEGLIVTCSHVVHHDTNSVNVFCQGNQMTACVIYATPLSEPYDLAVLSVGKSQRLKQLNFAATPPILGEKVITAGYPLSTESLVKINWIPTLSAGCVSKISSRGGPLQTTCCTQSGVSGGALLRPPNQLLGIVVSNLRLDKTIIPSIGLAVSVEDIRQPIAQYLSTKDANCLQNLCMNNLPVKMEWSLQDCKL